ncbi:Maltose permease [Aspergillus sclerotialis]|uniref:Maltose permease n=1 Tax=Aspergillus sclerotialis TaxID=2070753 RepID=A0A3A3A9F4_9EURO|nr:Maltose permease [Aspergillus sclerotialis]
MEKEMVTAHLENPSGEATLQYAKDGAGNAANSERYMSLREAIRLYPMAIVWSVGLSTAVVMEGYSVMLLSSFYALPQFNRKYGQAQQDGSYVIPASWKSGLSNGALCGEIVGLFLTGLFQDHFGYRVTIFAALCLITGFIFILFFAQNVQMLLAGEILCGLPWGAFQTITVAYASEVCPVAPRAHLTTYVNVCWVIGQFIVSGVLKGVLDRQDQWAYRIPFAVQWIWPIPLMVMCILAPESPWWLVRHNRPEEARKSLTRLMGGTNPMVGETLAMIQQTDHIEKEASEGTTYWECFRRANLRRTETVCLTWLIQIICGSQLMGYSTVFYIAAGPPKSSSFNMSLIQYALDAAGTILSWFLMMRAGRRALYLYGNVTLFCLLMIIGFVSLAPPSESVNWAIGALLSVFTFAFDLMVGPICYSRVRAIIDKTPRKVCGVSPKPVLVVNVLINYQLTSTAWNWRAKSAFFWAGVCFCCIVWVFFRLPEPKGRTYAELDVLFANKVSARKFASTEVVIFQEFVVSGRDCQDEKPT